jgi:P27 family predicted phage terminase small subunit
MAGNSKSGRKPKLAVVRELEGNRSKTQIPKQVEFDGEPVRPRGLPPEAKKFWDSIVPTLIAKRVVKRIDESALHSLCELWQTYRDLTMMKEKTAAIISAGPEQSGIELYMAAQRDYLAIVAKSVTVSKEWRSAAASFGLSPTDRAKLVCNMDNSVSVEDPTVKYLA